MPITTIIHVAFYPDRRKMIEVDEIVQVSAGLMSYGISGIMARQDFLKQIPTFSISISTRASRRSTGRGKAAEIFLVSTEEFFIRR